MGLDMYLTKKTYVKRWNHIKDEDQFRVKVTRGGEPYEAIKSDRIAHVEEEVAYWRKFNALHHWITEHTDGVDNCQVVYIDEGTLELLLETLKEVHNDHSKAKDLLPTQSGFFFGTTEYDEYYFHDVERTVELLENLLKEETEGSFYYHASW
jgi:hypothetical protein